jgi:hypothetical protein
VATAACYPTGQPPYDSAATFYVTDAGAAARDRTYEGYTMTGGNWLPNSTVRIQVMDRPEAGGTNSSWQHVADLHVGPLGTFEGYYITPKICGRPEPAQTVKFLARNLSNGTIKTHNGVSPLIFFTRQPCP